MPSRRKRNHTSLLVKAAEIGLATPQVVAHRVTRMALAGAYPAPRDRKEFERMATEKVAALSESWNAMALEAARTYVSLAASVFRVLWLPWLGGASPSPSRPNEVALGILGKGIGPIHRRAVANARRLAHTRLR
ncbi:MAG: polyhydroxyalkanoate granule-associated phasin [Rudaea sp.]